MCAKSTVNIITTTKGSSMFSGITATMTTTMSTFVWTTCLVALLSTSTIQAAMKPPIVDITPKDQVAVRLDDSLKILCSMGTPLQLCRVEIPGENNSVILQPGQLPEDGIEYYGEGIKAGQCGVHIARVKERYNGVFKCALTPEQGRVESYATVRIIVAKPPSNPILYTTPGNDGRRIYKNGQNIEISCRAPGGQPPANVSLYLDNEPIGSGNEERRMMYDFNNIDNKAMMAVQNASRTLDWKDNGKTLRCVATHIALSEPLETTMQLQVHYPPQPQQPIHRFGYVIGQPGIVNVTVNANPRPHFLWRVNDEKINEGRPDESHRLQTSTAVNLGNGSWLVSLKIDSVQKSDTEKKYFLEARNEEGTEEYQIVLSTSTEPAGVDLDAGSIIGIVVGVLVLILLVFLVIFARATGRWCFAGGSTTRNLGESSDTESAGRYSRAEVDGPTSQRPQRPKLNLTQLFKRNKDKVSGADTDTMRTVVTVDDEKIQTDLQQPAPDNQTTPATTGEGGIVYAELDLTQQQEGAVPRRLNEEKTEYAEILYTKAADGQEETTDKQSHSQNN